MSTHNDMNANDTRSAAINSAEHADLGGEDGLIWALVYLGDAIREATGDIGPAIEKVGTHIATEQGGIAVALNDIGREMVR